MKIKRTSHKYVFGYFDILFYPEVKQCYFIGFERCVCVDWDKEACND